MINQYPGWKYALIALVVFFGVIYALPNMYDKTPALVMKARDKNQISTKFVDQVREVLVVNKIKPNKMEVLGKQLYIYLSDIDQQTNAAGALKEKYNEDYVIAQTLLPTTPDWMRYFNAKPMYLGLDLQGGVHALMKVELPAAITKTVRRYHRALKKNFREGDMRYRTVAIIKHGLKIKVQKPEQREKISTYLTNKYKVFKLTESESGGFYFLTAVLTKEAIKEEQDQAVEKNIQVLRRRVDELGIAEPIIIRQGADQIVIELPGIQDPAKIWEVIGKQAEVQSRPLHPNSDDYVRRGTTNAKGEYVLAEDQDPLPNSEVITQREVREVERSVEIVKDGKKVAVMEKIKETKFLHYLIQKKITWSGKHVKNALPGFSSGEGPSSAAVHITLDDEGGRRNQDYASKNLGKRSAIVFVESVPSFKKDADGKFILKNGKKRPYLYN